MTEKNLPASPRDAMRKEQLDKVRNYRDLNRIAQKGQILFTGSSLMEQFPVAEYAKSYGLTQTIYNRGIGGTTTEDFLREIDTVLLDLEPKQVFINIGTNDFNSHAYGPNWQERLLQNYEEILRRLKEKLPETECFLMAYYPVNEQFPDAPEWARKAFKTRTNAAIADTNEKVKQLAERYGYQYIDANAGITDSEGRLKEEYTVDGIHMYAGGYGSVFEILKPFLKK